MTASTGINRVAGLGDTILGVWAHPDDEAYLMGGTVLVALAAGARVSCITATAGEGGDTADEGRWPQARLAEIRRQEMAASLKILGVNEHRWLELPDGGLGTIDFEAGTGLIAEAIERLRPDTVLTFGTDGMTGHPDHVAVGTWAHRAAQEVGGGSCRLLAATKTPEWAERFCDLNAAVFARPPPATPAGELALHVVLAGEVLDRKLQALAAQASQTSALIASIGWDRYRHWIQDECWVERPTPTPELAGRILRKANQLA